MKKILLIFMCMILLTSIISAWQWDDSIDYKDNDKTVIIENAYGLPLIGSEIATAELLNPLHTSNYIEVGKNRVVMQIEINVYDLDYLTDAIGDLEILNMNTGELETKSYYWAYAVYEDITVDDTEVQCNPIETEKNGTQYPCVEVVIGSHTETIIKEWIKITGADFPKGSLTLGLITDVNKGDHYDGIPTLFNKKFDRWVPWEATVRDEMLTSAQSYNNPQGASHLAGNVFLTKSALRVLNFNVSAQSTADTCGITDVSPGADNLTIANGTITASNCTFGLPHPNGVELENDTLYLLWTNATSYPYTQDQLDAGGCDFTLGTETNVNWSSGFLSQTRFFNVCFQVENVWTQAAGDLIPNVTINTPVNGSFHTTSEVIFNVTSLDDKGGVTFCNYSLTNGLVNYTMSNASTSIELWNATNSTMFEGTHTVNFYCGDSIGQQNDTENSTFFVDFTLPDINITFPSELIDYGQPGMNLSLNFTVSDNIELDSCWFTYNDTSINTTVTCGQNSSILLAPLNSSNNRTVTIYVNDTVGNENSSNITWDYRIFGNYIVANTSAVEFGTETFIINVTANSSLSAGSFIFNSINYLATNISNVWTSTIQMLAADIGIKDYFWNFTYAGLNISTTANSFTINESIFGLCNSTLTQDYLNFTFKNETIAEETINATIDSSTLTWWTNDINLNKTLIFSNGTENSEYKFCHSPPDTTVNLNVDMDYNNAFSQQRTFRNIFSLTNISTSQTLFLLPTANGAFITFQVINLAEQSLVGVAVNVTKGGVPIEQDITDDSGTVQFFLNQDTSYVFTFSKQGFAITTTTLTPTQTSYTVTLSGGAGLTNVTDFPSFSKGITITILPRITSASPESSQLNNDTVYSFNYSINSSFFEVSEFGFTLGNASDVFLTNTSTANGGLLNVDMNTGSNATIHMNAYYIIGTKATANYNNVTTIWVVISTSDTGFSVLHFFNDLNLYLGQSIFGLDNFALNLILFFGIFIFIGILSFKFGFRSPVTILGALFSIVAFLDVGVGILPQPTNAVPHFLTVFLAIIMIGVFLREGVR